MEIVGVFVHASDTHIRFIHYYYNHFYHVHSIRVDFQVSRVLLELIHVYKIRVFSKEAHTISLTNSPIFVDL